MLALALPLLLGALASLPASFGSQVYTEYCATCHRADFRGSPQGPPLVGVGMAKLDFYLTTGRMPAAVPWVEVGHRGEYVSLSPTDIDAIEKYLAPVVGAPPIPRVTTGGDLKAGRKLYELNCMHCHGVKGDGGEIGKLDFAPGLHKATVVQVAEAIRIGPGEMPQFGDHQVSQQDLVDLVTYVRSFDAQGVPPDVPPFKSTGPVPEGAVGWTGIIALIVFVFSYWRSDSTKRERMETVRPESAPGGEE